MKRILSAALFTLVFSVPSYGQESLNAEDMQFIHELRNRGYSDLAREYLGKLSKTAPPALRNELALEGALIEMESANEEPDSAKRIALYGQAREKFQQFLKANPTHPRASDAKFDIARATTLQGKAQLSRARLEGDPSSRAAEGAKARATFIDALNQLKQLPKTPESELAMALNLIDQSETYLNTGSDADTASSSKLVQEASKFLDPLAQGDPSSKITWIARAWSGRCLDLLDTSLKAIEKYQAIIRETGAAVQDGKRLARYFILLACQHTKQTPPSDTSTKAPLNPYLINQATAWLTTYPTYQKTPEGYGVRFLLAETLLAESENPKRSPTDRKNDVANARKHLSMVERTENDFTDRAKRLKLAAMAKLGTFKAPIPKLTAFEDCFARAQYEQMEIGEDAKKFGDDKKKAEEAHKARIENIILALQTGLSKPDAKSKDWTHERNTARLLVTYYLLEEKKYKEAIAVGEEFIKNEPSASQAASAAIYALLAHGRLLAERESKAGDAKELKDDPAYKADKERMIAFARQMEERWPKERAGDLARHEIAARLLRDDKTAEAITELAAITPSYPSYINTQFLLARAAFQQAGQDKDKGDPKQYRALALTTLSKLPEPDATADAETRNDYIQGKLTLALELYKDKKLKEVDALLAELKPKMESWPLDNDAEKDKAKRLKFEDGRVQLSLYSTIQQANGDFKSAKYKEVTQRLDPLVDQFNADKLPQLKESELAPGLIGLDLRANVQINNMERARIAIKALQLLQTDKTADTTSTILTQLVGLITQQIDDLRKKGDKDSLQKAQAGFTTILNEVAGSKTKPTPKLAYLLARCYSGMGEHQKALDLLQPFAVESPGADAPLHHVIQLLLVQEYRQLKDLAKARALLDEILKGKDGKPGWGAKNIDAQKALVMLLEDEQKYSAAAQLCNKYVEQLVRRLDDNKLKEHYFEFYYHLVYCILKHGQGMSNDAMKAKAIRDAAQRIVKLEKAQGGFGGDDSKKRFDELLEKETDLRQQYEAIKGGK